MSQNTRGGHPVWRIRSQGRWGGGGGGGMVRILVILVNDILAINHVILIAKMCISKYRYGK